MAVAMIGPKFYAWDRNGKPLAFGKLYTYQARTNTPKPTYQSEDQVVENTNPVILNGEGYANVYLDGSYKMVLKDDKDNEIWSSDPVTANQADEWTNCFSATYVSSTSFKVSGNQTDKYTPERKVRIDNNLTEYAYSKIISSVFASGETSVVVADPVVTTGINSVCVSITGPQSSISNEDIGGLTDFTAKNIADMVLGKTVGGDIVEHFKGQRWSTGGTLWEVNTDTVSDDSSFSPLTRVNVKDAGALVDGVTDDTVAAQYAMDKWKDVYIPEGTIVVSTLKMRQGQKLTGASKTKTVIKGNAAVRMITMDSYKHDMSLSDLTIDGDNVAQTALFVQQSFRGEYNRLFIKNTIEDGIRIEDNVYFNSFRDIKFDDVPICLNITPTFDETQVHAVVNANLFENMQLNNFSDKGIYMTAAAGNTFTCINYELAKNSATMCLRIDHCSNNKFLSNWFEPGNPTSMNYLVYINDFLAAFYTRNNEFDNCYFVGGAVRNQDYHILTGTALRNSVKNSTFLRMKVGLQNGSGSKEFTLDKTNTYNLLDGSSKIMAGSSVDRQIVKEVNGVASMLAGTDVVTIPLQGTGTDFAYDVAQIQCTVSEFTSITDQLNLILYAYKYSDRFEVFHAGAAFSGGANIKFDYTIKYLASTT